MELKDFIKNAITSISSAIKESQEELKDEGIIVNPERMETSSSPGDKILRSDGWRYVQNLEFDVSVVVKDQSEAGGKGELTIAGILNIGGGAKENLTNQVQNKLKFTIPIAFSTTKTPDEYSPNKSKMKSSTI